MLDQLRGRLTTSSAGAPQRDFRARLTEPVDPSALAVFRIGFGTIVAWEVWRAFDGNLIRADYDLPTFHFTWWLFGWVRPLPGAGIYIAFALLGIAAALVALGLFYRPAAIVTFVGITYWFLMEKASYLNHRYLASLFALLFVIVPAHAAFSLDARRRATRSPLIPAWPVWLMRFQVGVPYFFAGLAKLNFDWLVRAEPLAAALARNTDFPLIGPFLDNNVLAHVLAWGSTALDLFVPFLLLHRRTRVAAFGFAVLFHFINARLFEIGIFPWLMIVGTTIFFDPDWPKQMAASLRAGRPGVRAATLCGFVIGFVMGGFLPETFAVLRALVGGFGVAVLAFHALPEHVRGARAAVSAADQSPRHVIARPLTIFLALWIALQLLVPLRHHVIPGNVHWTEDGSRFSWQMLLRATRARVEFRVTDPATGETWAEDLSRHLTPYQISKLRLPDLLLEFAHYLDGYYREAGIGDVEVRVRARATLNGRHPQRLTDKNVDLTRIARPYIPPADWIAPLKPFRS